MLATTALCDSVTSVFSLRNINCRLRPCPCMSQPRQLKASWWDSVTKLFEVYALQRSASLRRLRLRYTDARSKTIGMTYAVDLSFTASTDLFRQRGKSEYFVATYNPYYSNCLFGLQENYCGGMHTLRRAR